MKRFSSLNFVLVLLLSAMTGLLADFQREFASPLGNVKRVKILVSQSYGEADRVSLPFREVATRLLYWAGVSVVPEDSSDYDATLEIEAKGEPIKGYYDEGGQLVFTPFPIEEMQEQRKHLYIYENSPEYSEYEEEKFLWEPLIGDFPRPLPLILHLWESEVQFKDILYTGAYLKGNISLKTREGRTLSEEFEGFCPPLDWVNSYPPYSYSLFPLKPDSAPFFQAFIDKNSFLDKCALLIGKAFGIKLLLPALEDKDWKVRASAWRALEEMGKSAVECLASALDNPREDIRISAVSILGNIKDSSCFEPLIQALKDESPSVRRAAIRALAKLGDKRAVKPLLGALDDGSKEVREESLQALAQLPDPQALERLMEIAQNNSEDWVAREKAIEALGKIGGKQAVDILIKLANSELRGAKFSYDLSHSIIKALGYTRDPRAIDTLVKAWREERQPSAALVSLAQIGNPAVEALLSLFNDKNYPAYRRADLARALGKIADKRAVESLVASLYEEDVSLREAVEWALYKIGEPSIPVLLSALQSDDHPSVREEAAKLLGHLKAIPAVEPLGSLLKDKEQPLHLRRTVAHALGKIDTLKAVQSLLSIVKDKEEPLDLRIASLNALDWRELPIPQDIFSLIKDKTEDSRMRTSAIDILARVKNPRAFELLLSIINDPGEEDGIKAYCVEVLGKIGDEKTPDILVSLAQSHPSLTQSIALALADMEDTRAIPYLLSIIEKSPTDRDSPTFKALKSLRSPQSLPQLLNLCRSDDPRLRQLGAELLASISASASLDALLSLLKDDYPAVRQAAASALGKLDSFQATEPLIHALKDDYAIVREASAKALGEIGDKRAVEALLPLLKDHNQKVRECAIIALGELGDSRALPALLEMLKNLSREEYWEISETAVEEICKALVRIGSPAVEPLLAILNDKQATSFMRELSVVLLGEIGDARAVEPLLVALEEAVIQKVRTRKTGIDPYIVSLALKKITFQDFGEDTTLWREWWETHKSLSGKGG